MGDIRDIIGRRFFYRDIFTRGLRLFGKFGKVSYGFLV